MFRPAATSKRPSMLFSYRILFGWDVKNSVKQRSNYIWGGSDDMLQASCHTMSATVDGAPWGKLS